MNRTTASVVAGLVGAGVLLAVGGNLHPRGSGDEVDDYLASMLGQSTWAASHLTQLIALILVVPTYLAARRAGVFGRDVDIWLLVAACGSTLGAVELIPHVLASRELDGVVSGTATPILDVHLFLQMFATPALGLTTAALALAVARDAGTKPAWILGGIAAVTGTAYAFAGPLTSLTENVAFTPLFPAQSGLALWMIGTGVRLALRERESAEREEPALRAS